MATSMTRRREDRRLWVGRSAGIGGLVFAVYVLVWNWWIRPYYFPRGDSFAVLVNSLPIFHPHIASWFLQGFERYFQVYPDLAAAATSFIRPGVNATFYLEWFVYHQHWAWYLLTTYAIVGATAGLVFYTATQLLELPWGVAAMAAFAAGLSPAVDSNALWDPTFAFDLLAGLLVLGGLVALLHGRLVLAWCLIGFAVFTKETAIFAPALAAAVVMRRQRPLRQSLLPAVMFLLPLAIWAALRWYDFRGRDQTYVLLLETPRHGAFHVALVRLLLGGLHWPLATEVFRNVNVPLVRFTVAGGKVVNVAFWVCALGFAAKKLWRGRAPLRMWMGRLRPGAMRAAWFAVPLFCTGSLLLPLLLNVPRRFGGVFFPSFALCLAMMTQRARSRGVRWGAISMMVLVGAAGAVLLGVDLRYQQPQIADSWRAAKAYMAALHESRDPVLFSLDDLSGGWSTDTYVREFAGYDGKLIRLNDLVWNPQCKGDAVVTAVDEADGETTITSTVTSACGHHDFATVYPALDGGPRDFRRKVPEATIAYSLRPGAAGQNVLTIHLKPTRPGAALLVPMLREYRERRVPLPTEVAVLVR